MKRKLTFLIAFIAVLLVGCAKTTEKETKKVEPVKTVEFSKLSKADLKKVDVTFGGEFNQDDKHTAVTMTVKNNTNKKIKINPDKFNFVNRGKVTPVEGIVTVEPHSKLSKKEIFTTRVLTFFADKDSITYDGKKLANGIVKLDNQAEFDEYFKANQPGFVGDTDADAQSSSSQEVTTTKPEVNTNQDANNTENQIVSRYLAATGETRFTPADYGVEVTDFGGKTVYRIRENHNSPAMKAAGADVNTSPVVATLYINDEGKLQDAITEKVYE